MLLIHTSIINRDVPFRAAEMVSDPKQGFTSLAAPLPGAVRCRGSCDVKIPGLLHMLHMLYIYYTYTYIYSMYIMYSMSCNVPI
jgi:hypothetical protein